MAKTIKFKSTAGYHKWLAFGHMHNVMHGKKRVKIAGKAHKVSHKKG